MERQTDPDRPLTHDRLKDRLSLIRGFLFPFIVVCLSAMAVPVAALPIDSEPLVIETQAGAVEFDVELALTPSDRATGLMFRQSMPEKQGMLFRFDRTRLVVMWMKNTPLPLDMVFIDENGVVAGVARDTVPFSEAVIPSPGKVRYVLELNAGAAQRHGIAAGDRVRHRVVDTHDE
ncbi:MAG: DUF192 domain-containing protein [Hoeflea sp.]|uniref:DUF192 domain-containing protein n=1 Tax=Hoeflea sp. TaxID=1940281 RepID=UPI0032EBEF04